jgi:hypothetical protein
VNFTLAWTIDWADVLADGRADPRESRCLHARLARALDAGETMIDEPRKSIDAVVTGRTGAHHTLADALWPAHRK